MKGAGKIGVFHGAEIALFMMALHFAGGKGPAEDAELVDLSAEWMSGGGGRQS